MTRLVIATRGSKLALWQANWVKAEIETHFPGTTVELNVIKTTGDRITDVPLAQVGGKGLFVKEIEEALLDRSADLAVHSMKDVPADLPDGLELSAITRREDVRDAFISNHHASLAALPHGARVGSSSLRRRAQIMAARPDLDVRVLRGNVDTRLRKLDQGEFDAILLAAAGMRRLGWADRIREYLSPELCLPAIGQGALGLETRVGDAALAPIARHFNHPDTADAVLAERALLRRLEGGCQVPIAALGTVDGGTVTLVGLVAATDGSEVIRKRASGPRADAERIGTKLAEELLAAGGGRILEAVYGKTVHEILHRGGTPS
ncbi:MAG: hydroxymethylbilane synthase [Nitrospirae bacterium]|nr:hydroxymethylbilane synthase [Nitrospirota bacterium]